MLPLIGEGQRVTIKQPHQSTQALLLNSPSAADGPTIYAPQKFAAYFLSKWTTAALPKPVDRDVHRIHTWISAIYQDRRFYAEPTGGWAPGTGAMSAAGSSISEVRAHGMLCGRCCTQVLARRVVRGPDEDRTNQPAAFPPAGP